MSTPLAPGGHEDSEPNDPDGIMNDQEMPTADGQMASNTTEEVMPPRADRGTAEDVDDEAANGDADAVTLDELP